MLDLIERLREKPEKTKKKIAFLTSFLFAGLIFVVWLTVIYPDVLDREKKIRKPNTTEVTPTSAIKENISSGFTEMGGQFTKLKGMMQELLGSAEYKSSSSTTAISNGASAEAPQPEGDLPYPSRDAQTQ